MALTAVLDSEESVDIVVAGLDLASDPECSSDDSTAAVVLQAVVNCFGAPEHAWRLLGSRFRSHNYNEFDLLNP